MNESQMAQIVAQILADKDYVFLPQQSYIEAVRIAFYEYSMYYPIRTSDEINIDTEQSYEYDLGSSLSNWVENFSVVLGVEIVQSGQSPPVTTRGSYLKSNYYEIEENIIDGSLKIKFLFRFKGKVKVYYTVPYQQLENVPQIDYSGIKYLACYYACLSSAARASQLIENYIGADKTTFDRRAQNFMKLADMYKKQGYTLLNVPEGGIYPFSANFAVPYIERRRAIRRTV